MNIIDWIQHWYIEQCDGDWEHQYGVEINTIDNPGWMVTIDLHYTALENVELEYRLIENSAEDWFGVSIEDTKYIGVGDPSKLEVILQRFKLIVEECEL